MTCENCVSFKVCHAVALAGKVVNADVQCDYFIDKDLINRQNAVIEDLRHEIRNLECEKGQLEGTTEYLVEQAKFEGVKEFAERLKGITSRQYKLGVFFGEFKVNDFNKLVKEMVGE